MQIKLGKELGQSAQTFWICRKILFLVAQFKPEAMHQKKCQWCFMAVS